MRFPSFTLRKALDDKGLAQRLRHEQPLRAELLDADQLEQHAKKIAGWHEMAPGRGPELLLPRLAENEAVLLRAHELIAAAVEAKHRIAPASEWLLDNFYLVEEHIRTARRHLPKGYSRELPRLASGASAGLPRVYDITSEMITHVDGWVDPESLKRFVAAYQAVSPLKLGELWAVPIMLRLALIENLRRIAARITASKVDRNIANHWADRFVDAAEKSPKTLLLEVSDMARSNPPLSSAFVAELVRRLHGQSQVLTFPLTWLEHPLAEAGLTIDQLVQAENQQQARDQVSIGHTINSLRSLEATDWREFVEELSLLDQALYDDPAEAYGGMDFATRDAYRRTVEAISRRCPLSEVEVAHKAVEMAEAEAKEKDPGQRSAHVGYFLVDNGLPDLEKAVRAKPAQRLVRFLRRRPMFVYLSAICLVTAAMVAVVVWLAGQQLHWAWLVALCALTALCASHPAVALVNWLVTLTVPPALLPEMDFSEGIPPEHRTLVAVPAMLTSVAEIENLLEGLEIRYSANRQENLIFALLTDFPDADSQQRPEDQVLLDAAGQGVDNLNSKYRTDSGDSFLLLHRPRLWNEGQGAWMGHERKRGKLADLNALLRGGPADKFQFIAGDLERLKDVRYVITLDADTDLPRDAAMRLAGKLAHPLNRPVMDRQKGLVVEGYSIIQPRVAVSLANANQSPFVRLFGGDPGLDPYTRAVSDVYQDLFLEGSFIGKGIYDLEAFETVLAERLPENRILSHDLLEGSYARAAMASDVLLYENFPSRYLADVSRRHRWVRGDWQIARWLMPRVPGPGGKTLANPICALSKWKILDNLRRSLVQPGLALLLALGWTVLAPAWVWTALAAGMVLTAPLVTALGSLFRRHGDIPLYLHLKDKALDFGRGLILALLALVLLPFEAFFSLDAVIRTVARLAVTRKKLLQWTPASVALRRAKANIAGYCRAMWFCPASAAGLGAALVLVRPGALYAALPLLGLWTLAPAVAWRLSVTAPPHRAKLNRDQRVFLRKLTRRTWRYFEMIVGPLDNWLPPDNYQEDPVDVIAYRTSPTNMGLSLLSNLAANDFGYIPVSVLMERTSKAFLTMNKLERFKGHFYNWYDTRSLRPLLPQYISTVDSGNLAGFLLTLAMGFEELQDMGLVPRLMHKGLADTLMVLLEVARGQGPAAPAEDKPSLPEETLELIADALGDLAAAPDGVLASISLVREMDGLAGRIIETLGRRPDQEVLWWARAFKKQCADHLKDLTMLAPWTDLPRPPHGAGGQGADPIQGLGGLLKGLEDLDKAASLRDAAGQAEELSILAEDLLGLLGAGEDQVKTWVEQFKNGLEQGGQRLAARVKDLADLSRESQEMADMDWRFLYDKSRNLMAIGYNVDERRADANFYDLLASEARLASFVAIALGDLPQKHWFALGRLLTDIGGKPLLLSWSGSMFEFLMPLLVMPSYEQTLLDRTYKAAVQRQIEYGRQRGVPWGVSESGYNITDANLIFQYRAFGVPGLGFKRGLAEDLVIAPYATVLSLMVLPEKACENLQRMAREGFMGRFGFYEAVDYTPSRVLRGQNRAVVRSFMVHHQGMSFLSLAYLLLNRPMQRRFLRDPLFQATDLLLQERMPKATPFHPHAAEVTGVQRAAAEGEALLRVFTDPNTPLPQVHLLSNGRYHVMVTNSGGGYSRWKDLAVTRWREDATRDNYGTFCYLRDPESGEFWSTGHHPTHKKAENYRAVFSQARAEFRRIDHELDTHTEITVSPEDDIELRRITITNRSTRRRTVELTSYAEVVLARPADEAAHPAFSNLFVQTEIVRQKQAILCTRRRRSHQEDPPWLLHLMAVHGEAADEASYETDRLKFIGRCGSLAEPAAMNAAGRLSDSEGAVLDPVVAIRRSILIEPEETRVVHLVTGMTDTRQKAMELMLKHRDRVLANRVFDLAWTHRQVVLRQINATSLDAQTFGRLASSVIYANPLRRAAASVIMKNRQGQSGLWAYGISGDLPIVILRIGSLTNLDIARQVIQAHQYWRHTGLAVDLIIWNEDRSGYRQDLQDRIMDLITTHTKDTPLDQPGGIFVRREELIAEEDQILLQSAAKIVLLDSDGPLEKQLSQRAMLEAAVPDLRPGLAPPKPGPAGSEAGPLSGDGLLLFNGHGGFSPDGREYVIQNLAGRPTPAPWSNILANPIFGSVISDTGGAYTWSENAHEFRLTPWYNDPVSDICGEAFYLRDEDTGRFWSPTPMPARGTGPYLTRHGFGYSAFEHDEDGVVSEMKVFLALGAPVKFALLKVRNDSNRARRLSATGFVEWVLGEHRYRSMMHVLTELDPKSGAIFARNPYNTEFEGRVAFFDVNETPRGVTGDRSEFIGRNGSLAAPSAMRHARLSGRVGASMDPCAAMQFHFELAERQETEIVFMLGAGRNLHEASRLVHRFRGVQPARAMLEEVRKHWTRVLGAVTVRTPLPAVDLMANGWLIYQTLACRYWARSGYYQSGGAYGFRDQLQDVMALLHAEALHLREHLLLCASRQFLEGDVQHWWHPPAGRGVRTHFSDDYLWLPLAVCRYVLSTGDTGVLDEALPYLEDRAVLPEEDAYYALPSRSETVESLYMHCVRAIEHGLRFGGHGLPLMGCGDWNDGMNLVGDKGKGESVWLGFFLFTVLKKFAELARARGDQDFAGRCEAEAEGLRENIELNAWDGRWYRRAYFDNGEPLGSESNTECQIDSLPQTWSIISGAGDPERSRQAMDMVYERLVRRDHGLIQLFDPPFDTSLQDPGYIKGYVPGVRENGGQYTHAAMWVIMAFAAMGDNRRAWETLTMTLPPLHGESPEAAAVYKVEPYVVAADVYAVPPHTGRGGWTWYTGAAGWMYRVILESLLGLRLEVDCLSFRPCVPDDWQGFKIDYRFRETMYRILFRRVGPGREIKAVRLDGLASPDLKLRMADDKAEHGVDVDFG